MAFKDNASAVTRLNDYNLRDLGGSASFEVQTISGRGLAPTRDRELQFPGEVGARNYGSFPSVRRIEVTGLLYANTQPDFRIGLDKLKELCRNRIKLNEVLYGEVEAQTLWFADEGVVHEGTAQAGATTTITLDTSASSTDDYYNDMEVEIIGGTGDGQVRKITDYTGSSRVATIAPLFATTPDSTSQFWVRDNRYYLVNYSGTMNETRITNQWMRTGYSNVTLPFKAVMPFAVSDWKKISITGEYGQGINGTGILGGDFLAIETGTAPSYPRYEIRGGGTPTAASTTINPAIIETTTAFQSNFNAAQGTGIANTVITPSVSTGIKHQSGKLNQALTLNENLSTNKFDTVNSPVVTVRSPSIGDQINWNQGTVSFWAKKPDDWEDYIGGAYRFLFDNYLWSTARVSIYLYGNQIWQIVNGVAGYMTVPAAMEAGEWYLFVLRYDMYRVGFCASHPTQHTDLRVYDTSGTLLGNAGSSSTYVTPYNPATTRITIGAFYYPSTFFTYYPFAGDFDDLAIWDRTLTDSEVTTLLNGGTGVRADSVGSSDLIYYSDFDGTVGTDMVNPIASSNVDTANASATTTTAVTVNGNGDKIFADNDRIVLYDETGYKVQGAVNGTATTTNVPIDDLAGGAVTDADKVGVSAYFDGDGYAYFEDHTPTGIDIGATPTFTMSAWVKTSFTAYHQVILNKMGSTGYGAVIVVLDNGTFHGYQWNTVPSTYFTVVSTGTVNDGKWHHLAMVVDGTTSAKLYIDGIEDGSTTSFTGTADSGAGGCYIGRHFNLGSPITGNVRDVAFWNTTALSAANILTLATNPISGTGSVGSAVGHWKLTEADFSSTADDSIGSNDLSNYDGNVTRTQQAYISKNLIADGNAENGGIGGWASIGTSTTFGKTSTAFKDAQAFRIVTSASARAEKTITTTSGDDYVIRLWAQKQSGSAPRIDAVFSGANHYLDMIDDTSWNFGESVIDVDDTSVTFRIQSQGTTSDIIYDDLKVLPNLINNGGMEGTWTGAAGAEVPPDWYRLYSPNTYEITSGQHSGSACLQMDNEYIYAQQGYLTLGEYYEVSWWVKVVSGSGGSRIRVWSNNPYAAWINNVSGPTGSEVGWNRYSEIIQVPNDGTLNTGQFLTYLSCWGGIVIQVDDVAMVHRPDLSPTLTAMSTNYRYEPTRLGMGYHTGGNENMVYAAVGNKDQSAGRVVFRPQFPYTTGENQQIFTFYADAAAGTVYGLNYDASVDKFSLTKGAGGSYYTATSVAQNFSVNDEIEVGWYTDPSSGVQIFVNGSDSGSTRNANTTSLATNPATLYIGDNSAYSVASNMIIDDLEILTKSMPAEWFAEQYAKRLASKNQNLYLSYYGTLDTGDILTLDCANTKIVTRAELYDASAGTRTSAINNATIYGSKMPILSERKSMLYFPATISNGVDIHFKKSWQ